MNGWCYDENAGADVASEVTFEAQEVVEYNGRTYQPGDEVTISLPKPIERSTLDDMAGEGGPWGYGGYTNEQLDALTAGSF